MIRIIGVGDIMPGGLLTDSINPCANQDILTYLSSGTIRVGTLECALGNEPTYDQEKVADRGNVIYAKDADVRRLKELHIDIVSLANNHFYDLGAEGAKHTVEILDANGIQHCGAGENLEEAGRPVVVEIEGKTLAFLAFCDTDYNHVYWCTYAAENAPGVNPMKKDYVQSEIRKAKSQYDYVVVLAHWGTEHTFDPTISTVKMSKIMFDAGADLILGSHPHRVQPVINSRHKSIAYSMGNFLFPERLIAPPKVTYYPDQPIDYSSLPVTEEYPTVDCVTLKSLPFLARVGMMVTAELDEDRVTCSYKFSYLDKENTLRVLGKEQALPVEKELKKRWVLLRAHCYNLFLSMKIKLFAIKTRIMKHI